MESPPVVGVVAFDLEENQSVLWTTANFFDKMTRFDSRIHKDTDSKVFLLLMIHAIHEPFFQVTGFPNPFPLGSRGRPNENQK